MFDEVKRLKEELKESNRIISVMDGCLVRNGQEIINRENGRAELQYQVDCLQEVLAFYADRKNYNEIDIEESVIANDLGSKARQALAGDPDGQR